MGTVRKVSPLLGESSAMEELRDFIVGVSLRMDPVLLTGDAGTGKGLAGQKIHAVGGNARAPFLKVSCHRFCATEIERLLFGRVAGDDLSGILGSRSGSTCHISGIEYLTEDVTRQLREYLLGPGMEPGRPRLLFSSRLSFEDLEAACQHDALFLETISTYHTRIPPLRDRIEDIPILSSYQVWLQTPSDEYDTCWRAFEGDLLEDMFSYPWPGNVRELIGFVQAFCGVRQSGSRSLGEACARVSPAFFLRGQFDECFENFLASLHIEALAERNDLILPPESRDLEFDDDN